MYSDTILPATNTSSPLPPDREAQDAATPELERLREELELVSYLTSHDLQAPLRRLLFACESLDGHPALSKDAEGKAVLASIIREATRMKILMQGLLDYLRLETFVPSHTVVDSNEVVATAMATLESKIQSSGGRITYDNLPSVYGHRGRLTRLFAGLFDNALTFNASLPIVHVSARRVGDWYEFCVQDNGIGIEEEYHTIIFGLFQRLHTEQEYPGHGTGLAFGRKIVEAHGGKIWIESAPGKGSRFWFTLPPAIEDERCL